MASLGRLTLDLIARVGGFTGPLDQAASSANVNMKKIADAAKVAGAAIGAVAVAGAGMAVALVNSTVESAREIQNLSAVAGLSTTEFQKAAAAGASLGIEQDKVSDIFKDATEKLGEYIALGSGPLTDFFTNIAPLVGVTADEFRNLNGTDALKLYVSSLEKANANQAEMTFYMEAIASDATLLLPLLKDNAVAFDELGLAAEGAGAIMSEATIASALALDKVMKDLGLQAKGLQMGLAAEMLPTLEQFSKDLQTAAKDAGGLGNVAETLAAKMVNVIAFVADAGDGVTRVFDTAAQLLVAHYAAVLGSLQGVSAEIAELLSELPDFAGGAEFAAQAKGYRAEAEENFKVAEEAAAKIRENLEKPLAGQQFKDYVAAANAAAAARAEIMGPPEPPSSSGGAEALKLREEAAKKVEEAAKAATKASEDAAKAAKAQADAINKAFESAEEGYERQLELAADANESQTLAYQIQKGSLVGINAEQQERLEGLAAELDLRNEQLDSEKAYADLVKELKTDDEDRNDLLRERLDIIQAMADVPADERAEQASRAISESTEDVPDFAGLAPEVGGPFGEFAKLDEAEQELNDWYAKQMEALAENRKNRADLNEQWDAEELSLKKQHEDALANIERARREAGLASMSAFFGQLAELRNSDSKKGRALGKAAAIAQATINAYTAATGAYASASAIPVVGWVLGPIAAGIALAAGLQNVAAIKGMAHDGIDSVPQDGTWLLQKGERVTTAETSAKLDNTLDSIRSMRGGPGGGGGNTVNQTFVVQGQVDRRTQTQIANDAARGQRQATGRLGG